MIRFAHLALPVTDEARSRAFYERHLGFGARTRRFPDGTLMLYDEHGAQLALHEVDAVGPLPGFLHFGAAADSPGEVRAARERAAADGLELVEAWDEPGYVSFKVRDPDGYVVEVFWED